jgi:hypothetical protein
MDQPYLWVWLLVAPFLIGVYQLFTVKGAHDRRS